MMMLQSKKSGVFAAMALCMLLGFGQAWAQVARVSNDGGSIWHPCDSLIATVTENGAFNYANTLSGNVVIELLQETSATYTLNSGFTFSGTKSSLTIRGVAAKSTLVKGYSGASMITFNVAGCNTTLENLIVEGGSNAGTANGGAIWFQSTTSSPTGTVRNSVFNHCYVTNGSRSGGAIYSAAPLLYKIVLSTIVERPPTAVPYMLIAHSI